MKTTLLLSLLAAGLASSLVHASSPKIVLVHGAFADASSWADVVGILQDDGYSVEAVENDLHSLSDDIAHTKSRIEAEKGPVILVGHSYGGAVISGAAAGEGNVKALVFVAAFAPDKGESLQQLGSGGPQPQIVQFIRPDDKGALYIEPAGFVKYFANHVPLKKAREMSVSQRPINGAAFAEALPVEPAWKSIPSFYAVSSDDQVIPTKAEEFFAKRIGAIETIHIAAGHASMVSNPKEVARLIESVAKRLGERRSESSSRGN